MVNSNKNNRGQILVLVAVALAALLAFAALAIDFGYFYHTKNQLQGAADAAALAGAVLLDGTTDPTQTAARQAAEDYAKLNRAAGSSVKISNNGANAFSDDNDIIVGNWDGVSINTTGTPINAMQVKARRTSASIDKGVTRIFGRIFDPMNTNPKQDISATATALKPARASEYISFCKDICSGPLPRELETGPSVTMNGFAWTTLDESVSSANDIKDLLCGDSPFADNCGKKIWSTMGTLSVGMRVLESLMYNPNYEFSTKGTDTSTGYPTWTVMSPYIDPCPPGAQPDPQTVVGYAVIHIKAICETGGGAGSVTSIGGPSCNTAYSAPTHACDGHNSPRIVIDSVQCFPCGDPGTPQGYRAILVK